MLRKSLVLLSIVFIIIVAACAQQKQWVVVTPPAATYPDYVATFAPTVTQSPTPQVTPKRTKTTTLTLAPSPTPTWFNRYRDAGATDEEAKIMDQAILGLKAAAHSNDREYIANMFEYPFWADITEGSLWISNKEEFLANYNRIFTPHLREVLANFEFNDDYSFFSYRGIIILHDDSISSTEIIFGWGYDGKISRIIHRELSGTPTLYDFPTNTPTLTFTPTPIGGLNAYRSPTPTSTPYWFPTTNPNMNSISTYFGTWVITSYEDENYDICKGKAEANSAYSQIGKKIEFLPDQVRISEGFQQYHKTLLTHIIYQWWDQYQYSDKYTDPLPNDHPEKQFDVPFIGVIIDRKYSPFGFEVTKSDRLVLSENCVFYFLDKIPPPTSSE